MKIIDLAAIAVVVIGCTTIEIDNSSISAAEDGGSMTFARVNPGGWALYETLTSSEMNQLDINVSNALDGVNGGDYSPVSALKVHGKIIGEAAISRVFLLPIFAAGQPQRSGTDAEAEWRFEMDGSSHWWESMSDFAQRQIRFDLNRFVPQDVTITLVRAYVNPSATQGTEANRMRLRVRDCDNVGGDIQTRATAYYSHAGDHNADWITTGAISVVTATNTRQYWLEIQSSNGTQTDTILSIEITYQDTGDYLVIP